MSKPWRECGDYLSQLPEVHVPAVSIPEWDDLPQAPAGSEPLPARVELAIVIALLVIVAFMFWLIWR